MNTSDFDGIFGEAAWWGGAHPADYISKFTFQGPKFFVFNTDESGGSGRHWIGVFVPASGPLEFFDPLGKNPEDYRRYFRFWLESSGKGYRRNEDRYQGYGTPSCGEFCVYYGILRARGCSMREILRTFHVECLTYNEMIVHDFVRTLV